MRNWHWKVVIGVVTALLALGFAFTPKGFVMAGDLRSRITTAIDLKVAPMVAEQRATNAKVDQIQADMNEDRKLLKKSLAATTAGAIRLVISKRCKTDGSVEREELNREKERLQDEYREYKGEYYREPSCQEL